ncbi:MAG: type II toxin-antitoxin system VapC family toxin [Candidatus Riflebacteria bacterium]|nr:type II toxin-antitoxin system VapC family toxin [Candidatus Riflebacteria bacterium]
MKQKIYVETTIPSFFYETRPEPDMVARREWTNVWWKEYREKYILVTSMAVVDELSKGNFPNKNQCLDFIKDIPILPITTEITDIVQFYIQHKAMPKDVLGDALHLALASFYKCDFLLTWNCKNLANANKFTQIRRLNGVLGIFVPILTTPLELIGD